MLKRFLGSSQRLLSSLPGGVHAAVKLRNQANAVVSAYFSGLSGSSDSALNGENWLIGHLAPKARNFIDVGANDGEWASEFVRNASGQLSGLLLEANTTRATALATRFGGSETVTVVNAAVADYIGEAQFYENPQDHQLSSLSALNAGRIARAVVVPVVTLDEQISVRRWKRISFVKIDTEGHDYFVLRGARHALEQHMIDVLQFECNSTWRATGITLVAAINFLSEFGYNTWQLRKGGLHAIDYSAYGAEFGYGNWVASHAGSELDIQPLVHS